MHSGTGGHSLPGGYGNELFGTDQSLPYFPNQKCPLQSKAVKVTYLLTYLFRFLKIIWQFHIYIYTLKLCGPLFSLVPLLFL